MKASILGQCLPNYICPGDTNECSTARITTTLLTFKSKLPYMSAKHYTLYTVLVVMQVCACVELVPYWECQELARRGPGCMNEWEA